MKRVRDREDVLGFLILCAAVATALVIAGLIFGGCIPRPWIPS